MSGTIVVAGATGKQGGAVLRALRAAGAPVAAMVRDPDGSRAAALAGDGVRLVHGNLDDPATLVAALNGARAVFSVQMPNLADLMGDDEVRQARNLAQAAEAAGVAQVVHSSVSRPAEAVDESRFSAYLGHYYRAKAAAEEAFRNVRLRHRTFLRPATFMENFIRPSLYFRDGTSSALQIAYDLDVPQAFIAVDDIGRAAAAAFLDPDRFNGVELELAGDVLSFREAAGVLSAAWGEQITLPPADGESGLPEAYGVSQHYMSAHPQHARPEHARAFGLSLTSLGAWAQSHR